MVYCSGESPVEKGSRCGGIAAWLGAVLVLVSPALPALARGDAVGAAAHPRIAGEVLASGEALAPAGGGIYALANPPPLEDRSGYDSSYLFAMTRGVSDSTLVTPLKVPLFLITIPLDIALLPVAAIAGFF